MIHGISQPETIHIHDSLRLRKFDGICDFAYQWYQDQEMVELIDGKNAQLYDMEKLNRMYNYLNNQGELYFIEIREQNEFIPIGDVTFSQEDMPIVIGETAYKGRGIGSMVVQALIQRAQEIGYTTLYVQEIYDFNVGSIALFTKNGFTAYKKTEHGASYLREI